MKFMYRFYYVVTWSFVLFVATFPSILKGSTLPLGMADNNVKDVCDQYMFPLMMAFALLIADVKYEIKHEEAIGGVKNSSELVGCVFFFLLCFILSLWCEESSICKLLFIIAWICMTILKFIKTRPIEDTSDANSFHPVSEN